MAFHIFVCFEKGRVKHSRKLENELYPLHQLLTKLDHNVINCLPAAHSLTGCDTVAKVGTKKAMLKASNDYSNLIADFGTERLDADCILSAEIFL